MSSIFLMLNDHIRRLARREVRAETSGTKRLTAQYRREIAALKRLIKTLMARVSFLEKRLGTPASLASGELPPSFRFRPEGLKSHRARLGLSAKDYGRLVGVSALTVYNWEAGKAKPRKRQLAALLGVRSMGKREVQRRLLAAGGA